jgi:hypothetical protein
MIIPIMKRKIIAISRKEAAMSNLKDKLLLGEGSSLTLTKDDTSSLSGAKARHHKMLSSRPFCETMPHVPLKVPVYAMSDVQGYVVIDADDEQEVMNLLCSKSRHCVTMRLLEASFANCEEEPQYLTVFHGSHVGWTSEQAYEVLVTCKNSWVLTCHPMTTIPKDLWHLYAGSRMHNDYTFLVPNGMTEEGNVLLTIHSGIRNGEYSLSNNKPIVEGNGTTDQIPTNDCENENDLMVILMRDFLNNLSTAGETMAQNQRFEELKKRNAQRDAVAAQVRAYSEALAEIFEPGSEERRKKIAAMDELSACLKRRRDSNPLLNGKSTVARTNATIRYKDVLGVEESNSKGRVGLPVWTVVIEDGVNKLVQRGNLKVEMTPALMHPQGGKHFVGYAAVDQDLTTQDVFRAICDMKSRGEDINMPFISGGKANYGPALASVLFAEKYLLGKSDGKQNGIRFAAHMPSLYWLKKALMSDREGIIVVGCDFNSRASMEACFKAGFVNSFDACQQYFGDWKTKVFVRSADADAKASEQDGTGFCSFDSNVNDEKKNPCQVRLVPEFTVEEAQLIEEFDAYFVSEFDKYFKSLTVEDSLRRYEMAELKYNALIDEVFALVTCAINEGRIRNGLCGYAKGLLMPISFVADNVYLIDLNMIKDRSKPFVKSEIENKGFYIYPNTVIGFLQDQNVGQLRLSKQGINYANPTVLQLGDVPIEDVFVLAPAIKRAWEKFVASIRQYRNGQIGEDFTDLMTQMAQLKSEDLEDVTNDIDAVEEDSDDNSSEEQEYSCEELVNAVLFNHTIGMRRLQKTIMNICRNGRQMFQTKGMEVCKLFTPPKHYIYDAPFLSAMRKLTVVEYNGTSRTTDCYEVYLNNPTYWELMKENNGGVDVMEQLTITSRTPVSGKEVLAPCVLINPKSMSIPFELPLGMGMHPAVIKNILVGDTDGDTANYIPLLIDNVTFTKEHVVVTKPNNEDAYFFHAFTFNPWLDKLPKVVAVEDVLGSTKTKPTVMHLGVVEAILGRSGKLTGTTALLQMQVVRLCVAYVRGMFEIKPYNNGGDAERFQTFFNTFMEKFVMGLYQILPGMVETGIMLQKKDTIEQGVKLLLSFLGGSAYISAKSELGFDEKSLGLKGISHYQVVLNNLAQCGDLYAHLKDEWFDYGDRLGFRSHSYNKDYDYRGQAYDIGKYWLFKGYMEMPNEETLALAQGCMLVTSIEERKDRNVTICLDPKEKGKMVVPNLVGPDFPSMMHDIIEALGLNLDETKNFSDNWATKIAELLKYAFTYKFRAHVNGDEQIEWSKNASRLSDMLPLEDPNSCVGSRAKLGWGITLTSSNLNDSIANWVEIASSYVSALYDEVHGVRMSPYFIALSKKDEKDVRALGVWEEYQAALRASKGWLVKPSDFGEVEGAYGDAALMHSSAHFPFIAPPAELSEAAMNNFVMKLATIKRCQFIISESNPGKVGFFLRNVSHDDADIVSDKLHNETRRELVAKMRNVATEEQAILGMITLRVAFNHSWLSTEETKAIQECTSEAIQTLSREFGDGFLALSLFHTTMGIPVASLRRAIDYGFELRNRMNFSEELYADLLKSWKKVAKCYRPDIGLRPTLDAATESLTSLEKRLMWHYCQCYFQKTVVVGGMTIFQDKQNRTIYTSVMEAAGFTKKSIERARSEAFVDSHLLGIAIETCLSQEGFVSTAVGTYNQAVEAGYVSGEKKQILATDAKCIYQPVISAVVVNANELIAINEAMNGKKTAKLFPMVLKPSTRFVEKDGSYIYTILSTADGKDVYYIFDPVVQRTLLAFDAVVAYPAQSKTGAKRWGALEKSVEVILAANGKDVSICSAQLLNFEGIVKDDAFIVMKMRAEKLFLEAGKAGMIARLQSVGWEMKEGTKSDDKFITLANRRHQLQVVVGDNNVEVYRVNERHFDDAKYVTLDVTVQPAPANELVDTKALRVAYHKEVEGFVRELLAIAPPPALPPAPNNDNGDDNGDDNGSSTPPPFDDMPCDEAYLDMMIEEENFDYAALDDDLNCIDESTNDDLVEEVAPVDKTTTVSHVHEDTLHTEQQSVYIGRKNGDLPQSEWANPYRIRDAKSREQRLNVIIWYGTEYREQEQELFARVEELKGKNLLCWCTPDKDTGNVIPCHGHVLAALADGFEWDYYLKSIVKDWDKEVELRRPIVEVPAAIEENAPVVEEKILTSATKTIFISGSRSITTLNENEVTYLESLIAKGYNFIVGDAAGVDTEVQKLLDKHIAKVCVYMSSWRNGMNFGEWPVVKVQGSYTQRDRKMGDDCFGAVVIWDGSSKGSKGNVDYVTSLGKKVVVMNRATKPIPPTSDKTITSNKMIVTGIGSREASPAICEQMTEIGTFVREQGWSGRSGHAIGCDIAFASGAKEACDVYLPWNTYNKEFPMTGKPIVPPMNDETWKIVSSIEPGRSITAGVKKIKSRNVNQVLGENLDMPSDAIVCWTKGGADVGGTAFAIKLARQHGIPVFNLASMSVKEIKERLIEIAAKVAAHIPSTPNDEEKK